MNETPQQPVPSGSDKQPNNNTSVGLGIALGLCLGVALGLALDNLALGIALGLGVGVAIGAGLPTRKRDNSDQGGPGRTPD